MGPRGCICSLSVCPLSQACLPSLWPCLMTAWPQFWRSGWKDLIGCIQISEVKTKQNLIAIAESTQIEPPGLVTSGPCEWKVLGIPKRGWPQGKKKIRCLVSPGGRGLNHWIWASESKEKYLENQTSLLNHSHIWFWARRAQMLPCYLSVAARTSEKRRGRQIFRIFRIKSDYLLHLLCPNWIRSVIWTAEERPPPPPPKNRKHIL